MVKKLPKYTEAKKKGNVGEALVQFLLSNICLVHKIDGSNDVGNDFICELIRDDSPTNLLFYVQVKYTQDLPRIRRTTLEYWKSSPIPVYVFWVRDNLTTLNVSFAEQLRFISYKRYTPMLHKKREEEFKPFSKLSFLEDLINDYCRTQYKKGFAPIIKPGDFLTVDDKGEVGFGEYKILIHEVIPEYSREILQGGGANMLSLAIALFKKGKPEDLKSALEILNFAAKFFKQRNDKISKQLLEYVKSYKTDIERRLR